MTNSTPPGTAPYQGPLSNEFLDRLEQAAGRGHLAGGAGLPPFLKILQANSPEVALRSEDRVEDAEPSDLLLPGLLKPVFKGTTGIKTILCTMIRDWVVWRAGRGGFVDRLRDRPADARQQLGENGRRILVRDNGDVVEETVECFLLVESAPGILTPCIFPCASTRLSFVRVWSQQLQQIKHPKTGSTLPTYATKFLLTTVPDKNERGSWFAPHVSSLGLVTLPEFEAAAAFADVVEQSLTYSDQPLSVGGTVHKLAPPAA